MQGIDPYAYMQLLAGKLDSLTDTRSLTAALDELEYLYEVMDPELHDSADDLIALLRDRLQRTR